MSMHTIRIKFHSDGAMIERTEWGRNRKQAIATLRGIYGDTFEVIA